MMLELRDAFGARKKAKRLGRGHSSGLGKTAGRGHKGQKARSGVSIKGFEGGQMPLYRRVPKRGGFKSYKPSYTALDLRRLEAAIVRGSCDPAQDLTFEVLVTLGLADARRKVKLLGNILLTHPVNVEVHAASSAAIKAVESAKGKVVIIRPSSVEEEAS